MLANHVSLVPHDEGDGLRGDRARRVEHALDHCPARYRMKHFG
jgi:hypothetical protein